jgi:hypothetical protein
MAEDMERLRGEVFFVGGKEFQIEIFATGDDRMDRLVILSHSGQTISTYTVKFEEIWNMREQLTKNAIDEILKSSKREMESLPAEVLEKL